MLRDYYVGDGNDYGGDGYDYGGAEGDGDDGIDGDGDDDDDGDGGRVGLGKVIGLLPLGTAV